MKPPIYRWVCHACSATNPAGVIRCANCAFPAFAPGRKIAEAAEEQKPVHLRTPEKAQRTERSELDWLIFFPEGILAVVVVLAFPFWLISLVFDGNYRQALFLFLFSSCGLALGVFAWRQDSKLLLYLCMLFVLLGASLAI